MEKTTIYFNDGKFMEYTDNSVSMISGNHLIITTKSMQDTENGVFIVHNTMVYDLATVKNFVKITPTRNINIEDNVSGK
jgi:hypothetical protein